MKSFFLAFLAESVSGADDEDKSDDKTINLFVQCTRQANKYADSSLLFTRYLKDTFQ